MCQFGGCGRGQHLLVAPGGATLGTGAQEPPKWEMPPWAETGPSQESLVALGAQLVPEQSRHFHAARLKI